MDAVVRRHFGSQTHSFPSEILNNPAVRGVCHLLRRRRVTFALALVAQFSCTSPPLHFLASLQASPHRANSHILSNMSTEPKDETKDKNRERAKASGDLDKVTDYVEEREMDASKMEDSMRAVLGSAAAAKKKADSALKHVKIQQTDVDLIVDEMELDPKEAEKALRMANGDVVQALRNLVRGS